MKKIITLVLIFCLTANIAFAAEEPVGKIIALIGQATAVNDTTSRKLELTSDIFPQDTITTSATGKLQIMFKDDTLLSVAPETRLTIDDYVYNEDQSNFLVSCTTGMLEFATGDIVKQNPEGFKFETPLNVIGIRGTIGGVMVGQSRGTTPPPCTAMLFHSSRPQNMSVTGKISGAKVEFSGFNQQIQQKNVQRITPPAPIPADVMNTFRKGTSMPPKAFGKQGPKKEEKKDQKQSGLSGGQLERPATQQQPESDDPDNDPKNNGREFTGESIAESATLTENTPDETPAQPTTPVNFEPTSASSVFAVSTMIYDTMDTATVRNNSGGQYGNDLELQSTDGGSSQIIIQGADPYSKIKYANFNYGTATDSLDVTIEQTPYTAPSGAESYLKWGYWTTTPANAPIIPSAGVTGDLKLDPVFYVMGDINNDAGSYISGSYSGQVNLLSTIGSSSPQFYSSTFTANVNVSGSSANISDMNMAKINIGSFSEVPVELQLDNFTGDITGGQFDLSGDVKVYIDGMLPPAHNPTPTTEMHGAMFGKGGMGGTIIIEAPMSDTIVNINGVFAGSADSH